MYETTVRRLHYFLQRKLPRTFCNEKSFRFLWAVKMQLCLVRMFRWKSYYGLICIFDWIFNILLLFLENWDFYIENKGTVFWKKIYVFFIIQEVLFMQVNVEKLDKKKCSIGGKNLFQLSWQNNFRRNFGSNFTFFQFDLSHKTFLFSYLFDSTVKFASYNNS